MKNLANIIEIEAHLKNETSFVTKGKMPKRGCVSIPGMKKITASQRRQKEKKEAYNVKTVFGAAGHSSWWN